MGKSTGFIMIIFLTITFIILKVTKFITWSWVWVFSPIWIPALLAVIFSGIILFWVNKNI